jgi:hypothetical protein
MPKLRNKMRNTFMAIVTAVNRWRLSEPKLAQWAFGNLWYFVGRPL